MKSLVIPESSPKINTLMKIGLILLSLITLMALLGPFFSPYPYDETHLSLKNQPPSREFWFGTDDLGRDIFTRVWYGARISLFVGMTAAFIDLLVGVLWGSVSAFAGGWIDDLMMRIADILYSLPYLLVVILLMVIFGNGLFSIILAMTVIGWITMARIIRGKLLQVMQQEYVLASIGLGSSFIRILRQDLLPNVVTSMLPTLTLTISSAIFVEAFLSFLGLGVQAPIASWGTMVNEGLPALAYYPWRLFFPAILISLTLLALNFLGEGLKDLMENE
jgi:oligopeptide transport system permease protein